MFVQPRTIEEALELKHRHGSAAAFLAGGTDVIVMMNHGRVPAGVFIDLSRIPGLDSVERFPCDGATGRPSVAAGIAAGEVYVCGGGATFARLARLPVACIAGAALSVGGPQIRNRATIGGNLGTASPAGDGSTALLSLDAQIEVRNTRGSRVIPARDFFLDYRKTALAPDELITAVAFPATWTTGWQKLGKRGAMNISLVCCSVGLSESGEFRIAFGSVGPFPLLAPKTGKFLTSAAKWNRRTGKVALEEPAAGEAVRIAAQEVRPIDDFRGSSEYRRAMSGVLLRKVLRTITQ